ncbi:MAG TPA: bifunctional riboflavin kinase/FAD synthetase [Terriglobales bacterium]|nr:bifunctional riboflavin kinase/FAD synthetase [Terriglobales bacterium]
MRIFRHLEDVPADLGPTFLSVGNFDGVHRAHQAVLNELIDRARRADAIAMVVTFDPHPYRILRPDSDLKLLTPTPVKLDLLQQYGIHAVLVLPFTRDLSLMNPAEFASQILVRRLHAREVHEGFNFRFGHKAQGDVTLLESLGRQLGFSLEIYPEMQIRGETVSSSQIRRLLREGNASKARHLLGRVFSIWSTPGRGRGYGHKYTVPTINLSRYDELVPADGVYITQSRIGDECFDSVTNVGTRPTFGADSFAIESHLLNFHPIDLAADTPVELSFLRRVRDEIKFPSVEALREQIARDVHRARRFFHLREKFAELSTARATAHP